MPNDDNRGLDLAIAAIVIAGLLVFLFWSTGNGAEPCPKRPPRPMPANLPPPKHDYDIYWEDPCVDAMRSAMAQMEPYLPQRLLKKDGFWWSMLQLTDEGRQEYEYAIEAWRDAKLQCWRDQNGR